MSLKYIGVSSAFPFYMHGWGWGGDESYSFVLSYRKSSDVLKRVVNETFP
jgi:hypothetical protein